MGEWSGGEGREGSPGRTGGLTKGSPAQLTQGGSAEEARHDGRLCCTEPVKVWALQELLDVWEAALISLCVALFLHMTSSIHPRVRPTLTPLVVCE